MLKKHNFVKNTLFKHKKSGSLIVYEIVLVFQLVNVGEEVLLFYNDRQSFQTLVSKMQSEEERNNENSALNYHINLVQLLALCTEGKNVYTEIKCHSLLPLDDIVRVVTHKDCIPEVSQWKSYNIFLSLISLFCDLKRRKLFVY